MSPTSRLNSPKHTSQTPEPDLYLSEVRVAELFGVSPRTLQQWRLRGGGPPFVQISSRCVRYPRHGLDLWMLERLHPNAFGESP